MLEHRLTRMWEPGTLPPPESLVAVMTLAAVPRALGARLADHLDGGLVVGPGSVPDLPAFEKLRAIPLPQQEGTWERSAGVYDPVLRRIAVGSVPSPSVNVCGHELGHAIDHSDGRPSADRWWTFLHALRRPRLESPYRQDASELFAESFACVLTRRTGRLITLLGGDEPAARQVYGWMSNRYGIG
ncbi:hypothetical protein [Nonomuraea sp. NPDC048826]|uniref:hypothetical protein n=1 Tax=Nonomuraea sp. NPDC048826 TaxID=3364347 RepID=UPI0037139B1F